ncbi:MAG: PstS family phosphate ABC transporter substrate-binding protein [Gaiellaceae bacterium]
MTRSAIITAILLAAIGAAGCGGGRDGQAEEAAPTQDLSHLSGAIKADGSSTVGPLTTLAAERFRAQAPDVRITVGVSGTGGGFEKFCNGETDLQNASRPIKDEEAAICRANGVDYVEFRVATDALTVVVNTSNAWADCLTVDQLKAIWEPGSDIDSWSGVPGGDYPDVALELAGPGTDSGTFDYFTDEIVGEEGASRTDYQASEDDNVVVEAVAGQEGGLGYFGFSYYDQNTDRLKAVAIDGGEGCVEPSIATAQSGEYQPLARPLFLYAKTASFANEHVHEFVSFYLTRAVELAEDALYVPLTAEEQEKALADFDAAGP